ncbi:hypothetical protein BGX38DRAFT_1275035 [Terfezia claveryi]|nr:hypothetical protein BGX38DRAFT_1275035 [Terfezia claveryi]
MSLVYKSPFCEQITELLKYPYFKHSFNPQNMEGLHCTYWKEVLEKQIGFLQGITCTQPQHLTKKSWESLIILQDPNERDAASAFYPNGIQNPDLFPDMSDGQYRMAYDAITTTFKETPLWSWRDLGTKVRSKATIYNLVVVHFCRWINPIWMNESRQATIKVSAEDLWRAQLSKTDLEELQNEFIQCVQENICDFSSELTEPKTITQDNYKERFMREGWRKLAILTLKWYPAAGNKVSIQVARAYKKATRKLAPQLQDSEMESFRTAVQALVESHLLARLTRWLKTSQKNKRRFPVGADTFTAARQRVNATLAGLNHSAAAACAVGPGPVSDGHSTPKRTREDESDSTPTPPKKPCAVGPGPVSDGHSTPKRTREDESDSTPTPPKKRICLPETMQAGQAKETARQEAEAEVERAKQQAEAAVERARLDVEAEVERSKQQAGRRLK